MLVSAAFFICALLLATAMPSAVDKEPFFSSVACERDFFGPSGEAGAGIASLPESSSPGGDSPSSCFKEATRASFSTFLGDWVASAVSSRAFDWESGKTSAPPSSLIGGASPPRFSEAAAPDFEAESSLQSGNGGGIETATLNGVFVSGSGRLDCLLCLRFFNRTLFLFSSSRNFAMLPSRRIGFCFASSMSPISRLGWVFQNAIHRARERLIGLDRTGNWQKATTRVIRRIERGVLLTMKV